VKLNLRNPWMTRLVAFVRDWCQIEDDPRGEEWLRLEKHAWRGSST